MMIIMEMLHVCYKKSHVNLIVCFDKYAVALRGGQTELLDDVQGEIPDSGSGGDLEYLKGQEENHRLAVPGAACHITNTLSLSTGVYSYLVRIIWEVHFV